MQTELTFNDGTLPEVGMILAMPHQHASTVFYRITKVNRRSVYMESLVAVSAVDADGNFVGINTRCATGTLHVVPGEIFDAPFKVASLIFFSKWNGKPVPAQHVSVATFSKNMIWKRY